MAAWRLAKKRRGGMAKMKTNGGNGHQQAKWRQLARRRVIWRRKYNDNAGAQKRINK